METEVLKYQDLIKTVKTMFHTSKHVNNLNSAKVAIAVGLVSF